MTEIERLKEEIGRLTAEVSRLKGLLDSHGISWQPVQVSAKPMNGLVSAQERDTTALRRPKPVGLIRHWSVPAQEAAHMCGYSLTDRFPQGLPADLARHFLPKVQSLCIRGISTPLTA